MSPESVNREKQHPDAQKIKNVYLGHIADGTVPPSYATVARRFGAAKDTVYQIVKREGLQKDLTQLRKETQTRNVFSPSRETAWFLGALFSNKGKVDPSRSELSLTMSSPDSDVLDTFRDIGSSLLSTPTTTKTAYTTQTASDNEKVAFLSAKAIESLGDFRRKERAQTLKDNFNWILSDKYIKHFASGVFDAGANVYGTQNLHGVSISTSSEETAALLGRMFRKLGIAGVATERKKQTRKKTEILTEEEDKVIFEEQHETYTIKIRRREDLKKLAETITSRSAEKQKQLDVWKAAEKKKREFRYAQSAQEIYEEWKRIKDMLNDAPPKTWQISALRSDGEDTFAQSVYTTYFGKNEKGKSSFVTATKRLLEIEAMEPDEREAALDAIVVFTGNKKYTEEELTAEQTRLHLKYGKLTYSQIRQLHKDGETPYSPHLYRRYLGSRI